MEVTPEIIANRRRFIAALRRTKNICTGSFFLRIDGKECRCPLGVAFTLATGVRTRGQFERNRTYIGCYEVVESFLGIPHDARPWTPEEQVTVCGIYRMNDNAGRSPQYIADWLTRVWFA